MPSGLDSRESVGRVANSGHDNRLCNPSNFFAASRPAAAPSCRAVSRSLPVPPPIVLSQDLTVNFQYPVLRREGTRSASAVPYSTDPSHKASKRILGLSLIRKVHHRKLVQVLHSHPFGYFDPAPPDPASRINSSSSRKPRARLGRRVTK